MSDLNTAYRKARRKMKMCKEDKAETIQRLREECGSKAETIRIKTEKIAEMNERLTKAEARVRELEEIVEGSKVFARVMTEFLSEFGLEIKDLYTVNEKEAGDE